ncbi:MAG: superoxide dismutase, partial [Cyanobacteriota bacterium]|nr:superoxide dismutase [Cyanobacteriota bacterium]
MTIRGLLSLVLVLLSLATPAWADFTLPPLPYAAGALEPAIDATTMTIHHDRHHAAYVANLNGLIAANPDLKAVSLEALQTQISH